MTRELIGWRLTAIVLLCIALSGCLGWSASPANGVAVLDLDRFANETGLKVKLESALKSSREALSVTLNKHQEAVNAELVARRKQYGDVPTVAQQRELRAFAEAKRSEIVELRTKADATMAARRAQLIAALQDFVKPFAERVAQDQNLGVVLLRSTNTLVVTDRHDITNAVMASASGAAQSYEFPSPGDTKTS
ncbi:MAG: OmpH family outer membrane protein [Pseudomonadota bacterium]